MIRSAREAWLRAGIVAGSYAVVLGVYVALSSAVAARVASSVGELGQIEQLKGLSSIVVSAVAVFVLCGIVFGRADRARTEVARQREVLVTAERQALAGTMAGAIAHDANNALMVLLSEIELMSAHDDRDRRSIELLRRSSARIVELNQRLVSAVRQSTVTDARTFELVEAVSATVEVLRVHDALRRARVEVEGAPISLTTNPALLSQILSNLLINAGEATDGHGHLVVRVSSTEDDVRIEVDDDGPGVPPERWEGLFSALRTTKPTGSGLGLYSVRACVTALQGTVEVGASPLGGARFTVTLPLAQDPG